MFVVNNKFSPTIGNPRAFALEIRIFKFTAYDQYLAEHKLTSHIKLSRFTTPLPLSLTMTTPNATTGRTAILFMDYQNDILDFFPASPVKSAFLASSVRLHAAAHKAKDIVIVHLAIEFRAGYPEARGFFLREWIESTGVFVAGTTGAAFHADMAPREGDFVIKRRRGSAFYGTELEILLRSLDVKLIYLAGISTSGCVLSATQAAADLDFPYRVVRECTFEPNVRLQSALLEELWKTRTVSVDEIIAGLVENI
ncbi:Isochorismatase-like protein [Jimgerdemannia flammicorona]|uniref:Isochorismatase-like protein n=1 Tax=Jimgerdemannia flammicorona TaxID=994334 RepID=A0A433QVQ4_9FUNG|nr:Isochorismatase-like protein [Jimgerdemannia flammicorona]